MKSIFTGLLISLVGTCIIGMIVLCLYLLIFIIPTYTGYGSVGLLLLTLVVLVALVYFMWCIGEIFNSFKKGEEE